LVFLRGEDLLVAFDFDLESDQLEFGRVNRNLREAKVDAFCEIFDVSDQYQVDALDQTLNFRKWKDAPEFTSEVLRFSNGFRVPPGSYEMKCLAQEVSTGKLVQEVLKIDAFPQEAGKLALSSLLMTQEVWQVNADSDSSETVADSELAFQKLRFPSSSQAVLDPARQVYVYFEIYNAAIPESAPRKLYYDYKIYNDQQVILKVPLAPLDMTQIGDPFSHALMFDFSRLPAGDYSFLVKVIDSESKDYAIRTVSFRMGESG
jgi:hypothetical protein